MVWLLKDCRCLFHRTVTSAAQKQGRPHCGTDRQTLPRLFQSESTAKRERSGRERPNFKRVYIGFHTTGRKCGQLTFDRSSILPHHTRIVRSLFPVFGRRRSKDERRSGWGQNCFDTQQEKHDTGLAESSPKPLDLRISLLLPFWS